MAEQPNNLGANDSQNSGDGNGLSQPRVPSNLQGLLRYSVQASTADGNPSAQQQPLDEQSRQFLEEAIGSMTVNPVVRNIKTLKEAFALGPDLNVSDCEEAFEDILGYVDNIDVANDFLKTGGLSLLGPSFNSEHSALRWRGAELVAELAQNNPWCQQQLLEAGVLPQLVAMADQDGCETVRVKALYAVSCLVRDNEAALGELKQLDGLSLLLRCLQSPCDKLQVKASFLVSALCRLWPDTRDELLAMGFVDQIAAHLAVTPPAGCEQALSALLSLVQDSHAGQAMCRRPQLMVVPSLAAIARDTAAVEECQEFQMVSLERRRQWAQLLSLFKLLRGGVSDTQLLAEVPFSVPLMRTRMLTEQTFQVPIARTQRHRNSPLYQMLAVWNKHCQHLDPSEVHDYATAILKLVSTEGSTVPEAEGER